MVLRGLFFSILFISVSGYAQLLNDAIVYFPFDGNVNDASSSAVTATNNGMNYEVDREGDPNEAISNNGGSNYVSFNDNAVKVQLPITLSAWVKLDAYQTNILFRSDNDLNGYFGYWVIINNSGNVGVSISGGLGGSSSNNRRTFRTDAALSLNTWQHLTVIIRDYDNMEVHFDCEKSPGVYHGTGATNMVYSNTESRIGADLSGYNFNGQIDELAIWDRELTSAELSSLCRPGTHLDLTEETEKADNINLYPNPMGNYLNIEGQESQYDRIDIIDVNGKAVYSYKNSPERLDVSELDKGVYFVKIFSQNKIITTRKVIKH